MGQYQTSLKYGFYGALLGIVFFVLLIFSGNSPWGSASWMGSWIPAISAYFAIKTHKSEAEETSFSFSQLFRISVFTLFFQAIIVNVLSVLLSNILQINSLELYRTEMLQYAEQIKQLVSEEIYNEAMVELQNATYSTLAFQDFTNKLIGGLIVSLILAGIFRKNKPTFENQHD